MRAATSDEATFNRKLFVARRRTEKKLEAGDPIFYIPSLSASTIVYKGMVMPQFLAQFYPTSRIRGWKPRWWFSTSAFQPTPCRSGACPSLPVPRPQRRDQHGARQPQLGGGARSLVRSPVLPDLSTSCPWSH